MQKESLRTRRFGGRYSRYFADGFTLRRCRNSTRQYSAASKCESGSQFSLFPLNRRGRLGRDVVAHAVGAGDLSHDTAGNAGQHVVGQLGPVGGHGIAGLDGTQDDRTLIGALVAHYANGLNVGQDREILPAAVLGVALASLLKQTLVVGVELLAHDSVGVFENLELLLVDRADDADGQTGPGKG